MQHVTLSNGVEMPILGFGVYQIPADETEAAVSAALEAGYRHLDTAAAYRNEEAVGRAIKASGIAREELFVTTKLWVQDAPAEQHALDAFERSRERLGLDVIDLYLVHQPFGDVYGQWRALERVYADGKARAIGTSNLRPHRILDLSMHADVTPMVSQIETHPFFQRVEEHEQLAELGVAHESWGPFAEAQKGIFEHPVLGEIAAAHERTIAQVVLRWLIQRDVIVIPKSVRPDRMAENFAVFDFELSDEEMARIRELDEGASAFLDHESFEWTRRLGSARIQ